MLTTERLSASDAAKNWRELYLAALFETDSGKLPFRITTAEDALLARIRELLVTSEHNSEEGKAVDKGLYAMRALRDCLELKIA
jgi:hypothetical protein